MVPTLDSWESMIIAAIALNLHLDLGPRMQSKSRAPVVTCHKGAVSYRFLGTPGVRFTYGGDDYRIPIEGSIEIIADGRSSDYVLAGNHLPVNAGTLDAFGTATVNVPMPQTEGESHAQARR
jgi:hypothetical protein